MLTENDVIEALVKYLRKNGYINVRHCSTTEHGIDIDAVNKKTGQRLLIEAKGGTSSKRGTNRYGRPFTKNQAGSHVAVALYCAARLRQKFAEERPKIALAFPDDEAHSQLIEKISTSLKDLKVAVYFVSKDKDVRQI